jgi:hypothetical protein
MVTGRQMKPTVYLETTIPSYLAAWQSPQIIMAARQQITHDWWNNQRDKFDVFISQIVLDESACGDPDASAKRLDILRDINVLEPPEDVDQIVEALLKHVPLPDNAANDPTHRNLRWQRCGLPANLELSAYCQRDVARSHGARLRVIGFRVAHNLHAGTTH